jgi:dihydroorotate dehydrogenase electron transfer subunit
MNNIPVILVSNEEIAPNCFRMVLSGDLEEVSFKPGQFIMLRLGSSYDPVLRRPFAAYTSRDGEKDCVEICYKIVGRGTRMMSRMRAHQELELLGPLGNGFRIPANTRTAYVVAGGMGVVPVRGLIDHLLMNRVEKTCLFLGTKTATQLLFQERFKELNISVEIATEDGSAGHHGFVTNLFGQWLETHHSPGGDGAICFACGPTPMLKAIADIVVCHQLPCQVSLEARMACGVGACLGCVVALQDHKNRDGLSEAYGRVCLEGPVFQAEDIAW